MVLETTVKYPAFTGEREREAFIYLPKHYEEEPERRYPVLYAFDGQNLFRDEDASFGKSWGLEKFLDENEVPLIVAAAESNPHPNGARLSEYAPYGFYEQGMGYIKARGKDTMRWYTQYFKPMVDRRLRTLPDRKHTFIMGSSMGALMTIYAILHYNHLFSRGIALSPALECGGWRGVQMASEGNFSKDTSLYMDMGEDEFKYFAGSEEKYMELTRKLLERHMVITSRIIPHGNHSEESWERQLPFVMESLFYNLEEF